MSTENKTIYARLIEFQSKVEPIKKNAKNPFFKSDYATLDTIQFAIQKPLSDAGLGYMQQATADGLKTTIFDVEGNLIETMHPAVFEGNSQEIGSAMSYAKRYALTAALGLIIEGEDDDGNAAQESKTQNYKKDTRPWLNQPEVDQVLEMIRNNKIADVVQFVKGYRVSKKNQQIIYSQMQNAKSRK